MYVQISRNLCVPCFFNPRPQFTEEVKEEVLPLSSQPEKVMRFSITRGMRNLIIKERHVAVRKICLFFSHSTSPQETKVTPVFRSLNLASSNLSR